MTTIGKGARRAARALALTDNDSRNAALRAAADAIRQRCGEILSANQVDMDEAAGRGLSGAMLDRLMLDDERVEAMASGIELAAELKTVVINFSGCPGGCKGDKTPNFVTCPWPDDFSHVVKYQWEQVLIPFWTRKNAAAARAICWPTASLNAFPVRTTAWPCM